MTCLRSSCVLRKTPKEKSINNQATNCIKLWVVETTTWERAGAVTSHVHQRLFSTFKLSSNSLDVECNCSVLLFEPTSEHVGSLQHLSFIDGCQAVQQISWLSLVLEATDSVLMSRKTTTTTTTKRYILYPKYVLVYGTREKDYRHNLLKWCSDYAVCIMGGKQSSPINILIMENNDRNRNYNNHHLHFKWNHFKSHFNKTFINRFILQSNKNKCVIKCVL